MPKQLEAENSRTIWFANTYGLTSDYALNRLYSVDTVTARRHNQMAAVQTKRAEVTALAQSVAYKADVDAARREALTSFLNMVEVRTKNANGIYTGTTTMS